MLINKPHLMWYYAPPPACMRTCLQSANDANCQHTTEESGSYFPFSLIQSTLLPRHIDRSLQGPEALTEPRCSQSVWWDWGDWCHGVLEPLKCRPSINMTKARPALSPDWNALLGYVDKHAAQSQIDTRRDTRSQDPLSRNVWPFISRS